MKSITSILILFTLFSCSKNDSDRDVLTGTYTTSYPISIDSVPLHDVWVIGDRDFTIHKDSLRGAVIYKSKIVWVGDRMELFGADNPYCEDMSCADIVTVRWGFWLYCRNGMTFCLQRI